MTKRAHRVRTHTRRTKHGNTTVRTHIRGSNKSETKTRNAKLIVKNEPEPPETSKLVFDNGVTATFEKWISVPHEFTPREARNAATVKVRRMKKYSNEDYYFRDIKTAFRKQWIALFILKPPEQ